MNELAEPLLSKENSPDKLHIHIINRIDTDDEKINKIGKLIGNVQLSAIPKDKKFFEEKGLLKTQKYAEASFRISENVTNFRRRSSTNDKDKYILPLNKQQKPHSIKPRKLESQKLFEQMQINKWKSYINIFFISSTYIITYLSVYLIESANIIFLGHSNDLNDPLLQLCGVQLGITIISTFGHDFIIGSMRTFDHLGSQSYDKKEMKMFYKLYCEAKIFSLLIFLLIILPFTWTADQILYFLNFDPEMYMTCGNFIKITLISVFLNLFSNINSKFLNIIGMFNTTMSINLVTLILHIIACLIFIFTYNLGAFGAGLALVVSSTSNFILTSYFIFMHHPFEEGDYKNILWFDTSTLGSSQFYLYVKYGLRGGFYYFVRKLGFNMLIFASYYLDSQKISLATNIILLNFFDVLNKIITGFSHPLSHNMSLYINSRARKEKELFKSESKGGSPESKIRKKNTTILKILINSAYSDPYLIYIWTIIYISIATVIFISLSNFLFKKYICFAYINTLDLIINQTICNNFGYIINIYSVIIFIDWGNELCIAVLKGMNKNNTLHLISNLLLLTVFLPLGLIFAFSFKLSNAGFWYSYFIAMVLFAIINSIYLYKINFRKECIKILKEISTQKKNDEEIAIHNM